MESQSFNTVDYIVFFGYAVLIIFLGLWVSREKKGHKKTAQDFFLASKALPWWVIGASLIASNISAEQFIGMSGSGFAIGLAIASYEWIGAVTLILVAIFILPVFLEKKIYTMPQFLEMRYDKRVRTAMASFWLLVYVFVNLTSILYLGALALETIMGIPLIYGILGLALVAGLYSIYGGLTAVAWTDVLQVALLIGGGLLTTYLAVDAVGAGHGFFAGMKELYEKAPEKFVMILEKGEMMIPDGKGGMRDAYQDLPGLAMLLGGIWIANISYWGFNQYIIQRGLAAKSVQDAKNGLLFAGYIKLLIPLIVVIPGIAAYVLTQNDPSIINPSDKAYPWLLHSFIPPGLKGLAFAALAAAIVSSLGSMVNSISTIFTMDIYRNIYKGSSDDKLVRTGRIVSFLALVIAVITAKPLLGNLDQAFQYIQEFTGFVTPAVVAIFILGIFWKKTTPNAALWMAVLTIPLSWAFKALMPEFPFLNRMMIVFLVLAFVGIVISLIESKGKNQPNAVELHKSLFVTSNTFIAGSILMLGMTAALYIIFW